MTQPALFISHGSPMLALSQDPAHAFLQQLGPALGRPRAILIASAHDDQPGPVVRAPARFRTWHDFGNFDLRLFEMRYEPDGAVDVADAAADLLRSAGLPATRSDAPQLDHGSWIPLSLMRPLADIPVATLSIDSRRDAAWHEAVGRALAPLRDDGVLIIGSGSISHNLHEVFRGRHDDRTWVQTFTDWLAIKAETGDRAALLNAMRDAPEALRNHPTDEHFLPFFIALGAGGDAIARRLHHSYSHGVLAMDAYAFGEEAAIAALVSEFEMAEHAVQ